MQHDGCSLGPGGSDSILYIFAHFSFFFLKKKKNILVVTWYLFLERVHAAERLLSSFALEEADVPPGS